MANEKMTWTELRKAVAEMAGTSEQEATSFLNALVDAILVGLKEDQQVKVKGIGTFALKAMAARKSVNIATGEEFTIEGYNKLTFSAEASLKESVEKRLEAPQTVEAVKEVTADPLKKLGEQAEEIVDILADLGQAVSGGSVEVEEVQEGSEVQEVQESSEVQEVEEKKEEVVEPPVVKEQPIVEETKTDETTTTEVEITIEPGEPHTVELLKNNKIDVDAGLDLLKDMEMYEMTLEEFYNELQNKLTDLENFKNEGNMDDYAILAHALKTEARYVGCTVLGDMAYEHELAGKDKNQDLVNQKFAELKTEANRIYEVVKKYFS